MQRFALRDNSLNTSLPLESKARNIRAAQARPTPCWTRCAGHPTLQLRRLHVTAGVLGAPQRPRLPCALRAASAADKDCAEPRTAAGASSGSSSSVDELEANTTEPSSSRQRHEHSEPSSTQQQQQQQEQQSGPGWVCWLYRNSVRLVVLSISFVLNLGAGMYLHTWLRGCVFLTLVAGLTLQDSSSLTARLLPHKLLQPHVALLGVCAALCALSLGVAAGKVSNVAVRWVGVGLGCCLFNSLMVDRGALGEDRGGGGGGGGGGGMFGGPVGRRLNGGAKRYAGRRGSQGSASAAAAATALSIEERWAVPGVVLCGLVALGAAAYYLRYYTLVVVLEEVLADSGRKLAAAVAMT